MARHDFNQALQLVEKLPVDSLSPNFNSRIAADLLQNNSLEGAATFLRRALSQDKAIKETLWLISGFRKSNETLANQLFLEAVEKLGCSPSVDCNDLLELGNYIYKTGDPRFAAYPDAKVFLSVNNITVIDLSVDRPDTPQQLQEAYLSMVANVLNRPNPISDEHQRGLCYALAYQLFPKAKTPELAGQFFAAKSANFDKGEMSSEMDNVNRPKELPKSTEDMVSEIEASPDAPARDASYVRLIFRLLWGNDKPDDNEFVKSRKIVDKVSNEAAKAKVRSLISLKEGLTKVKSGDLPAAEIIAARLTGALAPILWFAIAQASDPGQKIGILNSAEQAARKVENEDGRRPYFLLYAASQKALLNPAQSKDLLPPVISEFNKSPQPVSFYVEQVEIVLNAVKGETPKPAITRFPVDTPGVKYGFRETFKVFAETDPEGTIAAMKELKEELRAEALISIAWILIPKPAPAQTSN